jgi:peptidoglycan hydrolase-like protein with peptidoglycan-binding domain
MAAYLSKGSTGNDVKRVQEMLNFAAQKTTAPGNAGGTKLALLSVDGVFGSKTEARVKEFQTKTKIGVDGVVGPETGGTLAAAVLGAITSTRGA